MRKSHYPIWVLRLSLSVMYNYILRNWVKNPSVHCTKSKVALLVTIGFCSASINAQNEYLTNPADELFTGSPSETSFHNYNFLPTNLYTGKVEVDIPLYEVKLGDITVPIRLTYNTGGNRVDDIASNVGLGWNLDAGGSIIHIIKDVPDSELFVNAVTSTQSGVSPYYDVKSIGYHRRDYDYDNTKPEHSNDPLPNGETYDRRYTTLIDSSPDVYHAVAPGLNTKFVVLSDDPIESNVARGIGNFYARDFRAEFLDRNDVVMLEDELQYTTWDAPNILNPEYPSNYSPLFQANHEAKYLDHFTLVNSNGLKYRFNRGNISETEGEGNEADGFYGPNYRNYSKRVTSWNLQSIENPITTREVTFEYEEYTITTPEYITDVNFRDIFGPPKDYYYLGGAGLSAKNNVTIKVHPVMTRIKKINFEIGSVEFKYGGVRGDYPDYPVSEVIIRDNHGQKIAGYRLIYDYFLSKENCNDRECKRLKLTEIRVVDREEDTEDQSILKKYKFDYYEAAKLPNRKYSLEKDYLGYYRNNGAGYFPELGDEPGDILYDTPSKVPYLYYYPQQYELSILPFKKLNVTNGNDYRKFPAASCSGCYGLEPNFNNTVLTSLKKITYPTGGSLELLYENHEFRFEGIDYDAPGLRIKEQILDDGKGNQQTYTYKYEDANGNSSGSFAGMPVFGAINNYFNINNGIPQGFDLTIGTFLEPKSGYELTHGSFVGYSRIEEIQSGNGSTIYTYTSPKDYPNIRNRYAPTGSSLGPFLIQNSAFPNMLHTDQDVKRGKLLTSEIFNENGDLIEKNTYQHMYKTFGFIPQRNYDGPQFGLAKKWRFDNYVDFAKNENSAEIGYNSVFEEAELILERNVTTQVIKQSYLDAGTYEEKTQMVYDATYPFVTQEKKFVNNVEAERVDLTYPFELTSSEMQLLESFNAISAPVKVESTTRSSGTVTTNKNFTTLNANYPVPYLLDITFQKENLQTKETIVFDKFETENGNLLQYTASDGITTSIIWGYISTFPIAKIENLSYNNLFSYVDAIKSKSNLDDDRTLGDLGNEGALRTALNNLRNVFPEAMITTYTYDPGVGMTSMTDPKGYTVYYEYDEYNRLKYVMDQDGNVLNESEYNYYDQN